MKRIVVPIAFLFLMLGIVATSPARAAQMLGGYGQTSVANKTVRAAAAFAIKAQAKAMRAQKGVRTTRLKLIKILAVETQVVAGVNYRLKLEVKVNGKVKQADAVVFRGLKKPYPFELTSWEWSGQ